MAESTKKKVLLLLYPGFNILDYAGPYEILQKTGEGNVLEVKVAAESEITTSTEGAHVKRDVALDDALIAKLHEFEMLVVPGGDSGPGTYLDSKSIDDPLRRVITAYAGLSSACSGESPRILLSICTGSLLLGVLGVFNGRYCTSHWGAYDKLKERVAEAAVRTEQTPATVIPARFVDSGLNGNGVRIISSGGISCGMDASLHVVRLLFGEQEAINTAGLLDYAWHKTDGVVFDS
ncbi:ThiJ/PfpI family protein [Apodospora peruviana]|uniref:ThiJ/PfpI family protein n=1 Tax=Apodospora peruviana TaxID=516989 RepID=A0AAE0M2T5_9PEZI|nr:ThiJ/PfpI family protein [Apodospora peruviana]